MKIKVEINSMSILGPRGTINPSNLNVFGEVDDIGETFKNAAVSLGSMVQNIGIVLLDFK